mgnify:CR=1 FL=1
MKSTLRPTRRSLERLVRRIEKRMTRDIRIACAIVRVSERMRIYSPNSPCHDPRLLRVALRASDRISVVMARWGYLSPNAKD